jgi:tetratricopeptide (TPR) repeat protein
LRRSYFDFATSGPVIPPPGSVDAGGSLAGAARALFDAALALDPNDPDALAGEAYTYMLEYAFGWTLPGVDYNAKVLGSADRALGLAPDTMRAYDAKSYYLALSNRPDEGISVADAGLAINPNYARLYAARANAEEFLDRFEQAKSDVQQAARLSPRDPEMGYWHMLLCRAEVGLAHFDAAIDECHKSIEAGYRTFHTYRGLADAEFNLGHVDAALDAVHKMIGAGDRSVTPYLYLATDYGLEGKLDEANTALAEALRLNPKLTVNGLTAGCPTKEFGCLKYAEGLRKAGLTEE